MAKLINAKNIQLGGEVYLQNILLSSVSFRGVINLDFLPTLYNKEFKYVEVANQWFIYLKSSKRLEDINSYSRAILRYWNFLENNQLIWNEFPVAQSLKPTYLFRNTDLIPSVKDGSIKTSTANTYIRHVVQFYSWCIYEQLLQLPKERLPFRTEIVSVKNRGSLGHLQPKFYVQTSDLRIKEPNKNVAHSLNGLNPLSFNDLKIFFPHLKRESKEFCLMCLLACCSGLRAAEATSLTLQSLDSATPTSDLNNRFTIIIGPKFGVNTKYGKERKVELSLPLLQQLQAMAISERRLIRLEKYYSKNSFSSDRKFEYLFISQQGNQYSTASLTARWGELRKKIQNETPHFKYRFHELRSTYATYRIGDLLDSGIGEYDAIDTLMGYLGHSNESTMWKYIRYRKRREAITEKFATLDRLMDEICEDEDL